MAGDLTDAPDLPEGGSGGSAGSSTSSPGAGSAGRNQGTGGSLGGRSAGTGGSSVSTNGGTATGGTPSKAGSTGTAGRGQGGGGRGFGTGGSSTAAGGSSSGTVVPPSTCTEAQRQVCNNQIGKHCGYTFEYWKDTGTGCMTNTADGFSVEWSNIGNLLGRKGVRPGSANQIVTYEADYRPNGNSYLCVYGWMRGPLVEYYIVDNWDEWRPPGGEGLMGTLESDGATYDIYRTQRVNAPSIDGNATFYQYWSVRQQKRTSGTITVANHFQAWASKGMSVGSLYEVSMTVEGYQSSGTANVKVSIR